jgi:hypothetical protein
MTQVLHSLPSLSLLPSQPVDADQSCHLPEFGVPGDHGGFLPDGGGYGEAIGRGKGVLPLDSLKNFPKLGYL